MIVVAGRALSYPYIWGLNRDERVLQLVVLMMLIACRLVLLVLGLIMYSIMVRSVVWVSF